MSALTNIRQLMAAAAIRMLAACGYSLRRTSDLTHLADIHGSDKGFRKAAHAYTRVYDQLFRPLRREPIVLLELGLGNRNAPSLQMWRRYFTRATIFGFDIEDFSHVRLDRCVVIQGDVSSAKDIDRLVRMIAAPIDVIIDDASHASHHQQAALGALFPHLRSQGLYIIEDLHWRPEGVAIVRPPRRAICCAGSSMPGRSRVGPSRRRSAPTWRPISRGSSCTTA